MLRALVALAAAFTGFAFGVAAAHAEVRIALVIGEQNYQHVSRLPNTANDAALMAETLRKVGFTVTYPKNDLDKSALESALKTFARDSQGADVAVVYYAGHGLEFGGVNYLVPIDANLTTDSDVSFEAVPLELVLNAVSGARRLKMVLLDACRDNPFLSTMKIQGGSRSVERGLARIEPAGDTLVAYAAKAGSTAADGSASDSPFSLALSHNLVKPGLEIRLLMGVVRDEVVEQTGHKQEPAIYGSLGGEPFYFVPPVMTPPPALAPPPPQISSAPDPKTLDLAFWESIRNSTDIADFRAYLDQFPKGVFAAIARNKIADMSPASRPPAAAPPQRSSPAPQPPPPATRLAAEAPPSGRSTQEPSAAEPPANLAAPLQAIAKTITSGIGAATSNKDAERGMREAPAIISALSLGCTLTDAKYMGQAPAQGQAASGGSKGNADVYEVACQEGLGYVLLNQKPNPVALECLATASNSTMACRLPANSQPKKELMPYVAEAGRTCAVADAKYLGETTAGLRYFEVACKAGNGYVLTKETGKPAAAVPCLGLAKTKLACSLTSSEQNLAWAKSLTRSFDQSCPAQTIRYIGETKAKEGAFEASCASDGFLFTVDGNDHVVETIDCALATSFLGGCKMTTAQAAASSEKRRLSEVATALGFGCDVDRFRLVGTVTGGGTMVELACSNRADGAVGVFFSAPGRNALYDCIQVNSFDQACEFGTSLNEAYQKLSSLLASKGKAGCAVTQARYIGSTASGDELIETACAGGQPGWVIEVTSHTYNALNVVRCASVRGAATCSLPGNGRP